MAAQALAGLRDPYDVDLRRPSEEQLARLMQLADQWMATSAGGVFFFARQDRWSRPSRKTPRAVVESLVTHTQSYLPAYVSIAVTMDLTLAACAEAHRLACFLTS